MATIRLTQNEYNIGALAGKYALKNLSNTGKFSNIVEVLPVRTRFEIDRESGTITLKQGSLVTVPYGFSDVDGISRVERHERINKDLSITIGHRINDYTISSVTDSKVYLVYNFDAGILEADKNIEYKYFDSDVIEDGEVTYEGNTFLRISSKSKCALPLGYFDDAWHWHDFTALGFYEDLMWVDSGINYFIPRGRKEDYGQEVDSVTLDNVVYTYLSEMLTGTTAGSTDSGWLFLDLYGKGRFVKNYKAAVEYTIFDGIQYVSAQNYLYNSKQEIERICKVCDIEISNNKFHEFKNFNTYQTVDYADVIGRMDSIDESALHKDGRNETVLGQIDFPNLTTFDNILINGGNINNCNVPGNLTITNNGAVSFVDADLKNITKSKHPNCLGVVGKSNSTRGGLVFGANQLIKVLSNEEDASITLTLPHTLKDSSGNSITPRILPATSEVYDIGNNGQRFRNIYAKIFDGLAISSNWADLAEMYETDEEYPIGTLLQFGGDYELTIAKSEVNAVVSDKPGILMNSEGKGQPIALAGRVKVRVLGKVKKFEKIYLSQTDGIGTTTGLLGETPIGRALEDKISEDEGLVLCAVHFNI